MESGIIFGIRLQSGTDIDEDILNGFINNRSRLLGFFSQGHLCLFALFEGILVFRAYPECVG